MRPGLRLGGALALLCAFLGGALLGQGLLIHAKALLAQHLLRQAWQRSLGGEVAARPWSWADTWPVARLRVPELGVDVLVLAGGTGRSLAFGPGHLAGSADVGAPGNAVIGGHRDTHFAFLRHLTLGDELRAEGRDGRSVRYRVVERFVTHERDASVLEASEARRLTLVTCYPFDAPVPGGPLRFVVVAEAAPKA